MSAISTVNIDDRILVSKYAQGLTSLNDLNNVFLEKDYSDKRQFLKEMVFYLTQLKLDNNDIEKAISISGLKPTYTSVVKIRKGHNQNDLNDIMNLPESEMYKTFILFLSLYKVGYSKLFNSSKRDNEINGYKWWLNDLSDIDYVSKVKTLHNIPIVLEKLQSNNKEIGTVITAIIQFTTTIFEKNIIENRLLDYAFDKLYPNEGLNIYKEINDDLYSIVVLKSISSAQSQRDSISFL